MKWRVTVLMALAVLAVAYRGMAVYTHYLSPEMATQASFRAGYQDGAMVVRSTDYECGRPGEDRELCSDKPRPGDRILEIYDGQGNGGAVRSFFDYGALLRPINAHDPWTMVVERRLSGGESRRLTFTMPPAMPFERTTREWLIALGFDVYLPLVALVAALIIGLLKPNDKLAFLAALLFLVFATSFRQDVSQFPLFWREIALLLRTAAYCFAPYLILTFFLRYPDRSPLDRRAPWLGPLFLGLASGIFLLEVTARDSGYFSFRLMESILGKLGAVGLTIGLGNVVFRIFAAAAILLSLVSLAWNTVKAETRSDRRRMLIVLAGALAGLPPFCALYLTDTGVLQAPFAIMVVAIPLIGLFPLSFVYAIAKYRIFGIRIILRRSLKYALVSRGFLLIEGVLIFLALFFAAGPLLADLLPGSGSSLTSIGIAAATLSLVAGTRKLNRLVVPKIDRRFFRDAYDTRRILTELGRSVRRLISMPDQLIEKVADEISAALHPCRLALFLADEHWPNLQPLEGEHSCRYETNEPGEDSYAFSLFLHRELTPPGEAPSRRSSLPRGALLAGRVSLSRLLHGSIGREPESMEVHPLLGSRPDSRQHRLLPKGLREEENLYRRFDAELVVPLTTAGRVFGFMLLGEKLSEEPYTREDKELLLSVAEQVATALDNCQLISRVAEQRELEKEIQIAQEVQARLFPQERPPMRTLDYVGDCRSAHGVGGDYYDFLSLGPSRLGVTVADIAGKGLPASLLMASLQALVRSHAPSLVDNLGEFAREINHHLCDSTDDARFASLFFGVYDDESRTLRYLNAGHNPPILIRSGGEIQRLGVGGMVLGLFAENRYEEGKVTLDSGDLLVIFSDGITEAANRREEQFGDAALVEAIKRNSGLPPAELLERIAEEVDRFVGAVPPADDMTLIVARVV